MNTLIPLVIWLTISWAVAHGLYLKLKIFRSIKGILLLLIGFAVSVILHNLVYALFNAYFSSTNGDEAFFFILAFTCLGSAIFLVIYQLFSYLAKKRLKK
jgi:hypothetical protein